MDTAGGPDPKKARWSPNSFGANNGGNGGNSRDAFANYGYGPQSSLSQGQFNGTPSNGFGGALYSTPSLTINTNTGGNAGLPSQLSPNPGVTSFAQQTQTPISANANSPYLGFGYNMLGMGLPGMNVLGTMGGFPYNNQMGNFQVRTPYHRPPSSPYHLTPIKAGTVFSGFPPGCSRCHKRCDQPYRLRRKPPRYRLRRRTSQPRPLRPPRINPSPPREVLRLPVLLGRLYRRPILCRRGR